MHEFLLADRSIIRGNRGASGGGIFFESATATTASVTE